MGVNKNIGKNTIGDNNKMQVYLHDYNMSTHDLSTITRTSMSPGTLVPTMKLLVQKGDIIDIVRSKCTYSSNSRTTIRKLQTRKPSIFWSIKIVQQLATQQPNKNWTRHESNQATSNRMQNR